MIRPSLVLVAAVVCALAGCTPRTPKPVPQPVAAAPALPDIGAVQWHDADAGPLRIGGGEFQIASVVEGDIADRPAGYLVGVAFRNSTSKSVSVQGSAEIAESAGVEGFNEREAAGHGILLSKLPGIHLRSASGRTFKVRMRFATDDLRLTMKDFTVKPNESVTIGYTFEIPPAGDMYLELPAADFGLPAEPVRFRIPANMVRRLR